MRWEVTVARRRVRDFSHSDSSSSTDLEFFLLDDFGPALVTAFCEPVVAAVVADGMGARRSSAAVAVMRLNLLESQM